MQVVEKKSGRGVKDLAAECDPDNLLAPWNSMPSVSHSTSVFHKLYTTPHCLRRLLIGSLTLPGSALRRTGVPLG